jgi:hypothetical protein
MGPEGSYWIGEKIMADYTFNMGYLQPTIEPADVDGVSACADLVVAFEEDRVDTSNAYFIYAIGNAGHFYKMKGAINTQISAGTIWPYHISAGLEGVAGRTNLEGHDLLSYKIGTADCMLYSWDNDVSGSIGKFNLLDTFDDDYISTSAATSGMLSAGCPHPMIVGDDGILYIANGNKLVSYDGQTGAEGTYDNNALDFPSTTEITSMFKSGDYLGITTWEKTGTNWVGTYSNVYLWNYVDDSWVKSIPIRVPKIASSFNMDGNVYIFCEDKKWSSIRRLTDYGSELVARLFYNGATKSQEYCYPPRTNAIKAFENKMIIGTKNMYSCVFEYGKPLEGLPETLALKHVLPGTDYGIGAISTPYYTSILYSCYDSTATKYKIKKEGVGISNNWATDAYWAGLYTDFGQKVRINYIKYYFKPLTSGDSITPTISLDHASDVGVTAQNGTTTITYTTDGAIASKRFNVKKDCYCISPRLLMSGYTRIQKIVIDYQLISDL